MSEEDGKELLIVNGDRNQVFHEKDPAVMGRVVIHHSVRLVRAMVFGR